MQARRAIPPVGSPGSKCELVEPSLLLARLARNASLSSHPSCWLAWLESHVTLCRVDHVIVDHVIPARGHPDLVALSRRWGTLWV